MLVLISSNWSVRMWMLLISYFKLDVKGMENNNIIIDASISKLFIVGISILYNY